MKTQIIQLDQFDDLVSARDKLLWSKAARVIILFPDQQQSKFSLIDLQLLNRQVSSQGAQAAFVVRDRNIRNHLIRLGINAFPSVEEATRSRWKTYRKNLLLETRSDRVAVSKPEHKANHEQKQLMLPFLIRLPIFLVAILSAIILLSMFFPKVTIYLKTVLLLQEYPFTLTGDLDAGSVQMNGILPMYEKMITIEEQVSVPSTGEIFLPASKAEGFITASNLTEKPVEVPAGTVFSTSLNHPVRFASKESVLLPAGVGETMVVPIQAIVSGVEGNVGPGEINIVVGDLGLQIGIVQNEPMQGGSQVSVPSPSQDDYQAALDMLMEKLNQTAEQRILADHSPGEVYIMGSFSQNRIREETAFPQAGMPGETLQLWIQAEYHALFLMESDLQQLAVSLLDATLPNGYVPIEEGAEIQFLSSPSIHESVATIDLLAMRMIEKEINEDALFRFVAGTQPQQAALMLAKQFSMEEAPEIRLDPHWWPILPYLFSQYEVVSSP